MKKRLMIMLCCLVLFVQLLPVVPVSASALEPQEVNADLYYCRAQLEDLPNSAALLYAYDQIVAGINAEAKDIDVVTGRYELTLDEFQLALEAVRRDHTEQFWLDTKYTYTKDTTTDNVLKMHPQYLMTGDTLADAKVAFEQAIRTFVGRLNDGMSEYEKEKALHDMLATQVTYIETPLSRSAYGALVEGKAVCEGYAEALQCLLQRVGIQSIQVYGFGVNPQTGGTENHAWNMVRIDGKYYLTDLTWNDQDTVLLYAYFNQTTAVLSEDHIAWPVGATANKDGSVTVLSCQVFELPECTATDANYFSKNNLRITSYTEKSIGQMLKANKLSLSVFVDSDVDAFLDWLNKKQGDVSVTMSEIIKEAGVTVGCTYYTIVIGREVRIVIDACAHTDVELVAAKPATCDTDGNTAYYVCQNEECGKWFTDAEALDEIFNRDSVKVLSIGHDWTVRSIGEDTLKHTAANCTEKDSYWYICSVCEQKSDTYSFETEPGDHVDADGDGVCDLCEDGKTEFDIGAILELIKSPVVLGGGGGAILLIIIIAIIRRARD